jgi:hypothetical protein
MELLIYYRNLDMKHLLLNVYVWILFKIHANLTMP